ncbi:MAG: hypothetical protein QGI78_05115 [Phycisphaerales bacterium]|nr:hypothetical protein [Phycisphaerales bacterium]
MPSYTDGNIFDELGSNWKQGDSGIHVANYCKEIPSQEALQKQFRKAIARSKQRIAQKELKAEGEI